MRYATTATVNVSDLYKSLRKSTKHKDIESLIKNIIKTEFERQGIRFLDKPGLYPVPPCFMRNETVGGFPVITIKQGQGALK